MNEPFATEEEDIKEYILFKELIESIKLYNEYNGYDFKYIEKYNAETLIDIIKYNKECYNDIFELLKQSMQTLMKMMVISNEVNDEAIKTRNLRKFNFTIYNYLCLIIIIILSNIDNNLYCSKNKNNKIFNKLQPKIKYHCNQYTWLINIYELGKLNIDKYFAQELQKKISEENENEEDQKDFKHIIDCFINNMIYYIGFNGIDEFKEKFEKLEILGSFNTYDQIILGYILILLYSIY